MYGRIVPGFELSRRLYAIAKPCGTAAREISMAAELAEMSKGAGSISVPSKRRRRPRIASRVPLLGAFQATRYSPPSHAIAMPPFIALDIPGGGTAMTV